MKLFITNDDIEYQFDVEPQALQDIVNKTIHESLDPYDENRYHSQAYIRGVWDGRISICDIKNHKVPTGLYHRFIQVLDKLDGIHYSIDDKRDLSMCSNIELPDTLTVTNQVTNQTFTARDYQYNATKAIIENQRGIALASMNAGKTFIMQSTASLLLPHLQPNDKILIVSSAVSVVNQLVAGFQAIFGEDKVGKWQSKTREFDKPIIIGVASSIASSLKPPAVKLTNEHDKQLQRFATSYAPVVLAKGSERNNLALLVNNLPLQYKYQAKDKELLTNILHANTTDKKINKVFTKLQNQYDRLLHKKNGKKLDLYNETVDVLHQVKVAFCDEVQSASSATYRSIFSNVPNAVIRIGFTGTMPKEKSREYLIRAIFGENLTNVSDELLISRGISAHPHIRIIRQNQPVDLEQQAMEKVKLQLATSQQHAQRDLLMYNTVYDLGVINNEYRNQLVAKLASRLAEFEHQKQTNFTTLILVNSIEHGENICLALDKFHVDYAFVQGATAPEERKVILDRANNKQLSTIVATRVFDAGVDIKTFKYLIYASAGKSFVQTIQRAGRILRSAPNKQNVYIYDIVDTNSVYLYNQAKKRISYYKERKFDFK